MHESSVYQGWNLNRHDDALPQRSHLYRLQPIGVGSAKVESLTGYIARLAEAHNVSPGALLTRELQPRIRQGSHADATPNYAFIYDAYILNGLGECPHRWVRTLETLTGQCPLHVLTMLSWRRSISIRHLLRSNRSWCPQCFDQWRRTRVVVYEPLLWAIRCVSVCPVHARKLEDVCPHCKRRSPMLTAKSRPGYCFRCRHWLGTDMPPGETVLIGAAELSVANGVGELLAIGSVLDNEPSAVRFKDNLSLCIDHLAGGNRSNFARRTGMSLFDIQRWLSTNAYPSLDSFLWMCVVLRISPARFLTAPMPADHPDWEGARQLFARQHCLEPPKQPIADALNRQQLTRETMRETLESALQRNPAPSMPVVARSLGRTHGHLRTIFPDLCQRIKLRHVDERKRNAAQRRLRFQAETRVAILDLCERGISPSRCHVLAAIPNPSMRCSHIVVQQIVRTLGELQVESRVSLGT